MSESYPRWSPATRCGYCDKPIVIEEVGWRSTERDPSVDRVRCPHSPEQHPWQQKHQPAGQMRSPRVCALTAESEFRAGDPT
ncbi:hypothetical protein [Nonomuraea rubra]|uniref:Uncharacterized protein n=1 Tax=Nonomuraea rubra TaxID=46180 RepID=A0A7X0P6D2_9ACTN|nr:hypothetical protein [Nonomuraea rubra]MBB6556091.1 hypothetical protein [Nonomuraea rubra]